MSQYGVALPPTRQKQAFKLVDHPLRTARSDFPPAPADARPSAFPPPAVAPATPRPRPADDETDELPGSSGEHLLQNAYGTRTRAEKFYADQMDDALNQDMIAFVGRMEMAFIATADAHGEADCSLRAGPPGFLHVIDPNTLCYPEYRGNGVLASLGNIAENPHIGIMLIDFVQDRIGLHINGRASIVEDDLMRAEFPGLPKETVRGRQPERWVLVEVTEAYIHCRKHIPHLRPADAEEERAWGTDDTRRKGGDYFGVRAERRRQRADTVESETVAAATAPRPLPARREWLHLWRRRLRQAVTRNARGQRAAGSRRA